MAEEIDWFVFETKVRSMVSDILVPITSQIATDKEEQDELARSVDKLSQRIDAVNEFAKNTQK